MNKDSIRKYKDFSFKGKSYLTERSISEATKRSEKYKIKKKKDRVVEISDEMRMTATEKLLYYKSVNDKWRDRNSLIAAPFGAEIFLQSERAMPQVIMGSTRFFYHELEAAHQYPDARGRFPYDDIAHHAAKIIAGFFRRLFNRKLSAATKIQCNYRGYALRKAIKKRLEREREEENRLRREIIERQHNLLTKWSSLVRAKTTASRLKFKLKNDIMERRLRASHQAKDMKYTNSILQVQRFIRAWLKLKRKMRGRLRRYHIHARRIQALVRGRFQRQNYHDMKSAQIKLAWFWRKQWRKKYTKYGLSIQRAFRKYILYRAVVRIQTAMRGYLARTHVPQLHRRSILVERERAGAEQRVIEKALANAVKDFSELCTLSEKHVELMQALDKHFFAAIHKPSNHPGSSTGHGQASNELHTPPPRTFPSRRIPARQLLLSSTLSSQLTLALLQSFADTAAQLDRAAILLLERYYLRRIDNPSGETMENNATRLTPGSKAAAMATSHKPTVSELSPLYACTRGLRYRVALAGHVPEQLLARIALHRLWQKFIQQRTRETVTAYRRNCPARFACPTCLKPHVSPKELRLHAPCLAPATGVLPWVRESYYAPLAKELCRVCDTLRVYPSLKSRTYVFSTSEEDASTPIYLQQYVL